MYMTIEAPLISILQSEEIRNYQKYFSEFSPRDVEQCITYYYQGIPNDNDIRDLFTDDNINYFYEFFTNYINGKLIRLSAKGKV